MKIMKPDTRAGKYNTLTNQKPEKIPTKYYFYRKFEKFFKKKMFMKNFFKKLNLKNFH